jgi:endonuclease/exonuclease/phosphatase family metal-dependent hydrolase
MVQEHHPVFLGIQEGLAHQVAYIDSSIANYNYVGVGRDDGDMGGEYCALFYDKTKFECIQSHTFWLSETPDTVSLGWDAQYLRICTYGLFMHKATRERLWVFNTHFDHVAETARKKSAELIIDRIAQETAKNKLPVILMGDFNATPDQKPVQIITGVMQDAQKISETPFSGIPGTYNGYHISDPVSRRIDYIFIQRLQVTNYMHIDDKTPDGRWISDHLPVMATIQLNAGDKE